MSLLDPLSHALAAVVAGAHSGLTSLGADPTSGLTWTLAIAAVVVVVRGALLRLVVYGVRNAHAGARARPHLKEVSERYRGRTDPEAMRAHLAERRAVSEEHSVSRLGCLPVLIQIPVWIALYHLLRDAARGRTVGMLDAGQVDSLGRADIFGVPLTAHGYGGAGATHLLVVLALAGTTAVLGFLTQRYLVMPTTNAADLPEAVASAQQVVPFVSAGGILLAGGVVPVALLVYWVCGAVWTTCQSAVIWRWFPTPGSPAAERHDERARLSPPAPRPRGRRPRC